MMVLLLYKKLLFGNMKCRFIQYIDFDIMYGVEM